MAGHSQKFPRQRRARRALRQRLAQKDPDHVPPPALTPGQVWRERLTLIAVFLVGALAILGVAFFD